MCGAAETTSGTIIILNINTAGYAASERFLLFLWCSEIFFCEVKRNTLFDVRGIISSDVRGIISRDVRGNISRDVRGNISKDVRGNISNDVRENISVMARSVGRPSDSRQPQAAGCFSPDHPFSIFSRTKAHAHFSISRISSSVGSPHTVWASMAASISL